MFDFGFSEILLTSAIALVVVGPRRLPSLLRAAGNLVGRARKMSTRFRNLLESELAEIESQAPKPKSNLPTVMIDTDPMSETYGQEIVPVERKISPGPLLASANPSAPIDVQNVRLAASALPASASAIGPPVGNKAADTDANDVRTTN